MRTQLVMEAENRAAHDTQNKLVMDVGRKAMKFVGAHTLLEVGGERNANLQIRIRVKERKSVAAKVRSCPWTIRW